MNGVRLVDDAALWLVVAVFTAGIAYGTFNGVRWVAFVSRAIAEAQTEEVDRFATQEAEIARINRERATVSAFADPRNPDAVGRGLGSRYAVLPPTALATLAVGQSDLLPSYVKMTSDAKETVLATTELENPQRLLTGRFDLAFVLIYLYPLLILALTFNLLSSEKEQRYPGARAVAASVVGTVGLREGGDAVCGLRRGDRLNRGSRVPFWEASIWLRRGCWHVSRYGRPRSRSTAHSGSPSRWPWRR